MSEARSDGADAFAGLSEPVREALSERGFRTPTEPQRRAVPPIAAGEDVLVIAPTGTGKTETAMLPVFDALVSAEPRFGIGALYVTPLRALNRDMRDRLTWWGETLGLDVDVRHGDTTRYQRTKQADDPPDVLITTPETLQAMLTGEKLRRALEDVDHVVIDEVHELASSKRGAQLAVGLERLRDLAGPFQRVGLSATVGDPAEVGRFLTADGTFDVVEVDSGSRLEVTVRVPEITPEDERLAGRLATEPEFASHVREIRDLVDTHESTLVFVNTRQTAEALGSRFTELEAPIGVHHGSLSKEARIDVEDRFKAGALDGLICTSSMELGIDVGRVDHVVQYGSPREVARLVQRVGRAGHRADEVSRGTVIARGPDDALEALAIARRAGAGEVEPARLHHGSLDTVANQIAGIVMSRGEIDARDAYRTVTRAYPFRDLSEADFKDVVTELWNNRVIWLDEEADRLERTGGMWQYVYGKLSMIPDEETYEVRDVASGSGVGTLDEKFVVNFAEPGASFIQRGEMWRIVEVDEDEGQVEVSPVEDPAGEVPSWVGEEIPVPAAVAQEVGRLRGVAADQLRAGASLEAVAADLGRRYPGEDRALREAITDVAEHAGTGHPLPTDDRVVVEGAGGTVLVNAHFGHRANETLGRLLAALLGQRVGSSVGMEVDPYRIDLDVPPGLGVEDVVAVLRETDPDHVEPLLELSLKRSETLAFTLSHVAETFGRIKRWEGKAGRKLSSERLIAALEDTPVYAEAVREVFHDDLAVDRATDILRRLDAGDLALETVADRTPVGRGGTRSGRELLTPENADASVIQTVRDRLQEDRVRLYCLHCGEWDRTRTIKTIDDQPACPHCESTRIAALHPWADEAVAAIEADERDADQEKQVRRAYQAANLVQSHGKKAVIALAGRGVGPTNAARIINNWREDEDDFYRDILTREREYARTKAFWD